MRRIRSIPFQILFVALTLGVNATAAEPPWLELHSKHYTVITDAGEKRGREVALRFEQMRAVFGQLLGRDRLHESRPLTILALKNDKDYFQVAPLRRGKPITVPGFLISGDDQDFVVLNLFEVEPWRAVAHDFAIRLLNFNYPPDQPWFDEGLGEYFSTIRLDNKHVEMGGDPELEPSIAEDLFGNEQNARPPKSLTELLGGRIWLSLPDLFTLKHDTTARNQGIHNVLYYAESWIVIYYILHQKKLSETGTYFDLVLNQHVPVEDAIKQAYGMNSGLLEHAIHDYFSAQTPLFLALDQARQTQVNNIGDPQPSTGALQPDRFPVPVAPDDSVITSTALPDADARAYYAGVQTRIPERREVGLKTLNDLATTETEADKKAEAKPAAKRMGEDSDQLPVNAIGNALAHRNLAWDHLQHGEYQEAFSEISDAAALNPRDSWLRYYQSLTKYRMAQAKHTEVMGLSNMILDLKSVLEWDPEMADAYDLLALARNAGGTSEPAMQAERAAMTLSPRNELYVFHLAEIYVASKKWEAANALLARLKTSSNPQIALLATDLLSQAGTERKYGISLNATGGAQTKYEPQKSPFDVLEQDAAKREAAGNSAGSATPVDKRVTKYARGRLVAVDCSKPPIAILTVHTEDRTLKLRSDDYRNLLLIGADDFSCQWRDRQVTANYKAGTGNEGDLVSLEMR